MSQKRWISVQALIRVFKQPDSYRLYKGLYFIENIESRLETYLLDKPTYFLFCNSYFMYTCQPRLSNSNLSLILISLTRDNKNKSLSIFICWLKHFCSVNARKPKWELPKSFAEWRGNRMPKFFLWLKS